jgi:amidohydrolase
MVMLQASNTLQVLEQVRTFKPKLVEMRRHFHQYPELAFQEVNSAGYIAEYLSELGMEIRSGMAKTGVVGLLNGNSPGKTIALRADMDALPISEETGASYASQNEGVMHACGHDGHMACLLGAATILSKLNREFSGRVRFIFQPAEEGPGGARPMIEEGALEGVDAIIGCHLWFDLPVGTIGFKYGSAMACLDSIDVTIVGKGGHGANPHQTVDAIAVSSQVISALQTIASREVSPVEPVVVTIGTISGGHAYNIIADRVTMKGTVRAINPDLRSTLPERIERIIGGIAKAMRADYEFKYHFGYPPLINHYGMTAMVEDVARKIVGPDKVIRVEKPTMGGEDMAYYLEKVPGTFAWIGIENSTKGICHSHHNAKFDIDEDALVTATQLLVLSAIEYLGRKS